MDTPEKRTTEETVNVRLEPESPDTAAAILNYYLGYRQAIKDFAYLLFMAILVSVIARHLMRGQD